MVKDTNPFADKIIGNISHKIGTNFKKGAFSFKIVSICMKE